MKEPAGPQNPSSAKASVRHSPGDALRHSASGSEGAAPGVSRGSQCGMTGSCPPTPATHAGRCALPACSFPSPSSPQRRSCALYRDLGIPYRAGHQSPGAPGTHSRARTEMCDVPTWKASIACRAPGTGQRAAVVQGLVLAQKLSDGEEDGEGGAATCVGGVQGVSGGQGRGSGIPSDLHWCPAFSGHASPFSCHCRLWDVSSIFGSSPPPPSLSPTSIL